MPNRRNLAAYPSSDDQQLDRVRVLQRRGGGTLSDAIGDRDALELEESYLDCANAAYQVPWGLPPTLCERCLLGDRLHELTAGRHCRSTGAPGDADNACSVRLDTFSGGATQMTKAPRSERVPTANPDLCYGAGMAVRSPLLLSLVLPALALVLAPEAVEAEYRYLCTSVPSACGYAGPDAPMLDVDVCFSPTAGTRLKSGSCPDGWWPYRVEFGEVVDPITNEVAPYVPLDDACSQPGNCVEGPPPPDAQEFPMCCKKNTQGAETCYDNVTCGGSLWWCNDGVCNDDGTITCFNKEAI